MSKRASGHSANPWLNECLFHPHGNSVPHVSCALLQKSASASIYFWTVMSSQRILYMPIQSLNLCHVWMSAKCPNKNGENIFLFQPYWDSSNNYEIQFFFQFSKIFIWVETRMKHFRPKCILKNLWFIRENIEILLNFKLMLLSGYLIQEQNFTAFLYQWNNVGVSIIWISYFSNVWLFYPSSFSALLSAYICLCNKEKAIKKAIIILSF